MDPRPHSNGAKKDELALDGPTEIVVAPSLRLARRRGNFHPCFALRFSTDGLITSRFRSFEPPSPAIALRLGLMAPPAAGLEIAVRRRSVRHVRLDVIELGFEAVTALHTAHPVEFGWLS
jgi:hypothetical protein